MNDLQILNSSEPEANAANQTPIEVLLQVGEDEKVSAGNVYRFLELHPTQWPRWSRVNIVNNQFAEEGIDYWESPYKRDGKLITDFRLSVPFAKKLCMLSKTERGEQARDYFIKVEQALKSVALNPHAPMSPSEMILQIAQNMVDVERRVAEQGKRITQQDTRMSELTDTVLDTLSEQGEKLDKTIKAFSSPSPATWKADMNRIINALTETYSLSKPNLLGRMYRDLETATSADLSNRLKRMQKRLKKIGARHRDIKDLTKLEVIDDDKRLRAVFEGIAERYEALYAAKAESKGIS